MPKDNLTSARFRLNGKEQTLQTGISIRDLCDQIGVGEKGFAVERNGVIVPRSAHRTMTVEPGDQIEIVHMVGGG